MGFMDFMHTYCKLGKHFDWLPSSYISIYVLGSKNWDVVIQNFNKTQFWPNFMGFKVEFYGFYGYIQQIR